MNRKKNIIFLMLANIALSANIFASESVAAAQQQSTLAAVNSKVSQTKEIAQNSLMIGTLVAIPCVGIYGMKKFFEWWNITYAIKGDTEAIRRTQNAHGIILAQHGQVLEDVRRDQKAHGEKLDNISGALERNDRNWSATLAWQTAQDSAAQVRDAALKTMSTTVDGIASGLAAVNGKVTVLQTDVASMRKDISDLKKAQERAAADSKRDHENTQQQIGAMKAAIIKEVQANGVPAAADRIGVAIDAALMSRAAVAAKPYNAHTGGAAVLPSVTPAIGLWSTASFPN